MARPPKKIPELPTATSAIGNVYLVVEVIGVSSNTTSKILANNAISSLITGPYADDAAANTGGVSVGDLYYDSSGTVKIRLI